MKLSLVKTTEILEKNTFSVDSAAGRPRRVFQTHTMIFMMVLHGVPDLSKLL